MPFRSERQRRYLWKFHPDLAKRWAEEQERKGQPQIVPTARLAALNAAPRKRRRRS